VVPHSVPHLTVDDLFREMINRKYARDIGSASTSISSQNNRRQDYGCDRN
jgi:hypothetical protein